MSPAEAARALLGPGVAVAGGPVAAWDAPLLPDEAAGTERFAPRRRAEFGAGRAAARAALAALGLAPAALPRRPDGPPAWPPGVTGSITHGGGLALAAVGRAGPSLLALGLDLEPWAALDDDLARAVCREGEDRARALEVFGAKEAAYKALFMRGSGLLGFGDLRVALGGDGRFRATLLVPSGPLPPGLEAEGRQARAGGLLLSALRLP